NLFAGLASAYVAVACASYFGWEMSPTLEATLGISAGAAGLLAVVCSMMIYIDTRRVFWGPLFTVTKFFGTCLVLGIPVALLISLAAAACSVDLTIDQITSSYGGQLCRALIVVAGCKLLFEAMIFGSLRNQRHTALKRTALLLRGELSMITTARFILGSLGGILLPLILLGERQLSPDSGFQPLFVGIIALLMTGLCLAGEFIERYLFFTAVVAPKMPGTQAT
ncbi:MAG: DmsC/YnfH family molybdoenzyme membrane anchor subunit, partial [Planctomycetota bacterium]